MADMINFTRGVPPAESFPNEELIECTRRVINAHSTKVLQYGSAAGYEPLREFIAQQYSVGIDQVIIGQGSLQLLDLLCRVSLEKRNLVFVEQPTYDRTLTIFRRAKADLHGFRLVNGQINIDEIKKVLEKGLVPKYFYVISDFQNPNGSVMGVKERQGLTSLARQYGFLIIEDSPYRRLRYEGKTLPSLFEISPDVVVYMSSYSKLVSPGLRTGYMILPRKLAKQLIKYAEDTYLCPSFLNQAVVLDFIEQGMLEKQLKFLIHLYRNRLRAILSAMDLHLSEFGEWVRPQGGFFVGINLNTNHGFDLKEAALSKLELSDGRGFFLSGGSQFIRLPFCALNEEEIATGIERLSEVITAFHKGM
ncbi:MAG: PLP-dependent aminotransferase family protein [Anaerolineaceae bacterium]|nr:PLP-dependent aminotransferase family protein [Anaerolineaceae bacterium]